MSELPIINLLYEIYKTVYDINSKLTKKDKFTIGKSIETTVLTLIEHAIIAKNCAKPLKIKYLLRSQSNLEILMMKLRLMHELKLANETRLFQLQANLQEVGRMLGGWLKSQP